jgi:hypothetical protein
MHYIIDIFALIVLLFFFLSGWRKGLLLSSLGIARVVLAYGMAYLSGRYLGSWLGEFFYRPRIVIIPVTAGMTFILITFAFHLTMSRIREKHRAKEKQEEKFHLPYYRCFLGGLVSMAAGLLSMIFIFWLSDLAVTGLSGQNIAGSNHSVFGRFARRATYEGVYALTASEGRESQAAAMARVISNPAKGLNHLQQLLSSTSIRQVIADRQLPADLLSGSAQQIYNNESIQQMIGDQATREELLELGIIDRRESEIEFCEKLARFGQNENIQTSLQNLKARDLLRKDRILKLIRDPDFDIIVAEVVK